MSHITGNSNDHAMLQAIVFTWRRTQKTHPGATIPTPLELVLLQAEELLK